jgi:hypothetical protein
MELLSCLNSSVLRLPIAHLYKQVPAIIAELEKYSRLLVMERRAFAEGFAPAEGSFLGNAVLRAADRRQGIENPL